MSHRCRSALLVCFVLSLLANGEALQAQDAPPDATAPGRRYSLMVGGGVSASPLGEIAERHGLYAVPGRQFEVRGFARSPGGHEWSLALLWDDYHIGQEVSRGTRYDFDYHSTSVVVGYQAAPHGRGLPVVYGADAGWVHYTTAAHSLSYYTGEPHDSRTVGDAAVVGAFAGLEIPGEFLAVVPRIRVEMNFPDFGGGDGYSILHRETDVGLKATIGLALKAAVF